MATPPLILVSMVARRLRSQGDTAAHPHRLIQVNTAHRSLRFIRANTAAHSLNLTQANTTAHHLNLTLANTVAPRHRLIKANTVDLRLNGILLPCHSSNKSSQEESLPTPWNKTWIGCASAPLPLPPIQVSPVHLLQMDIPMKSKMVLLPLRLELELGLQ